ncbi:hypothetical protein HMPREF0972_00144 [Actinomyces sp. oral taxon 848 str. F0332]|nr:hypothetical protein HMPREF0972_00144 [Actinomyces sp. oral taxon 848 str. F0332]
MPSNDAKLPCSQLVPARARSHRVISPKPKVFVTQCTASA